MNARSDTDFQSVLRDIALINAQKAYDAAVRAKDTRLQAKTLERLRAARHAILWEGRKRG